MQWVLLPSSDIYITLKVNVTAFAVQDELPDVAAERARVEALTAADCVESAHIVVSAATSVDASQWIARYCNHSAALIRHEVPCPVLSKGTGPARKILLCVLCS